MSSSRRIFLKQMGLTTLGTSLLATNSMQLLATPNLKVVLPRSTPEQQGISSLGLLNFLNAIERSKIEFHSVMVLRHGSVVAEGWWTPYAAPLKHTLYSLSKSFTSSAIGLAITEGKFKLDTPVVSFFPDQLPVDASANLKAMTVQHLLMMGTGNAKDTMPALRSAGAEDWVKTFLAQPVEFEPGTHFVYNTGATYMLSAIIQKVTGKTLQDYLKPRLFDPLGIDDYDWEWSPQGINTGGYGLRVRTEDIAKFGQMYLQKGKWNGTQILPEAWVADASTSHIDNSPGRKGPKETDDWAQGYGYQFWRCTHGAYRGDGAFGQFCIVMPEQDMVVAITGESFNLQASIGLVWSDLLPAVSTSKLPPDTGSGKQLSEKLKSLSIEPPRVKNTSGLVKGISGKEFLLEENEFKAKSVSIRFGSDDCLFTLKDEKGAHVVKCGLGKWIQTENSKTQQIFPMAGRPEVSTPINASATWNDENTLMMTWRFPATAHSDNIFCQFASNKISIKFLSSISKNNPASEEKRMELKGTMS